MERVDGTQARLKRLLDLGIRALLHVERVDGTQARLKLVRNREIVSSVEWKGWMGLRRD